MHEWSKFCKLSKGSPILPKAFDPFNRSFSSAELILSSPVGSSFVSCLPLLAPHFSMTWQVVQLSPPSSLTCLSSASSILVAEWKAVAKTH